MSPKKLREQRLSARGIRLEPAQIPIIGKKPRSIHFWLELELKNDKVGILY